jgi:hypothetical protein
VTEPRIRVAARLRHQLDQVAVCDLQGSAKTDHLREMIVLTQDVVAPVVSLTKDWSHVKRHARLRRAIPLLVQLVLRDLSRTRCRER